MTIMKMVGSVALVLLLQQANGCDQSPKTTATTNHVHYQRFVPIPGEDFFRNGVPWNGYFALDTKTGLLCLTVDDFVPKDFPSTPTCTKLLTQWPDTN
jgi:hypothetical protein